MGKSKPPPNWRRKHEEKKAPVKKVMTEDDYLEATDEFETASAKWRRGDLAKSVRFIQRAFDSYEEGLKAFPSSFDLAYNKAVMQYEVARNDALAQSFGSKMDLLRSALDSHRYALRLKEENPDVLFNTAQLLTEISEELDEFERPGLHVRENISLLQEAIELFSACLTRQEMLFSDFQSQETAHASGIEPSDSEAQALPAADEAKTPNEEEWAVVEEPVTAETLIDSTVAMLDALTALLKVFASLDEPEAFNHPGFSAAAIVRIGQPLIEQKLPAYIELVPKSTEKEIQQPTHQAPPTLVLSATGSLAKPAAQPPLQTLPPGQRVTAEEASIAAARFRAALACAEFNSGLIDPRTLVRSTNNAFLSMVSNRSSVDADEWDQPRIGFLPDTPMEALDAYSDAVENVNLHLFGYHRRSPSDLTPEDIRVRRLLGLDALKLSLRCLNEVIEGLKNRSRPVINPIEDEVGYTVSLYVRAGDAALQARTHALHLAEEDPGLFTEEQREPAFTKQAQEVFSIAVSSYAEAGRLLDEFGGGIMDDVAKLRHDVKAMSLIVRGMRGDLFSSIDLSTSEDPRDLKPGWVDDIMLEMMGKGMIEGIEVDNVGR
ncbi:hypothetical protein P152DRAFT_455060 [Eremomyces bilateralis CBS 781.70]|uniref:TPR-like protein n=1 Tax=Eremomyces bilateralis CBS 781.70 TaxID=1392243 RepID=A0A6G1GBF8_9PEZI|nr:uncharacterized protein P152DRAFT_455060 [Eremomyces bilateralis CBS 781.70]KAF1815344.1 hypothetical protein P152DRAFT_455060 [Eremomyces bilateralis CBS 781.70]